MAKVVAVAILYEGLVHTLPAPSRHVDVLHKMRVLTKDMKWGKETQGFIGDNGVFLDRKQAMIIARENGQLINDENKSSILFSEDVW